MTMGCSGFFLLLLALTQDVGRGQEENRLHRVLSNGVGIPVRVRRGAPVVARAMCAGLNLPPALVAGSRYRDQVAKFEVDKAKADKAARLAAAKVGVVFFAHLLCLAWRVPLRLWRWRCLWSNQARADEERRLKKEARKKR